MFFQGTGDAYLPRGEPLAKVLTSPPPLRYTLHNQVQESVHPGPQPGWALSPPSLTPFSRGGEPRKNVSRPHRTLTILGGKPYKISRPDPTQRAPTRATSLNSPPPSCTPHSRRGYPYIFSAVPPLHKQSRGVTPIKICSTLLRPSERPPRLPSWPAPPFIAHLAAEEGTPGNFFSAPPGHTQSGGVTPLFFSAHNDPARAHLGHLSNQAIPHWHTVQQRGVPLAKNSPHPPPTAGVQLLGGGVNAPL